MIRDMPQPADYRALPGRDNVNILDDGSATRVKIDLFPEYIRNLPPQKRELWDVVGRALCSHEVRAAFVRRLAPGLERRFGSGYADVGMFPIPILTSRFASPVSNEDTAETIPRAAKGTTGRYAHQTARRVWFLGQPRQRRARRERRDR